jgi:hypothetical protein
MYTIMNQNKKLVAVAGGTSPTLGTAIVNALAESTTCTPVILSRLNQGGQQPQTKTSSSGIPISIRYVEYNNTTSLVNALRDVHTVISVIKIPGPDWATYQINLLNAATQAGVKRFAPSEFEQGALADGKVDIIGFKLPVWESCKESGLEVARFECGGFMNAMLVSALKNPRWDDRTRERINTALHGLNDEDILWNLEYERAEDIVKDDGTSPRITLTKIGDVGRFVAAACELPDGSWKSSMSMVGETLTVAEVSKTIEDITGVQLKRSTIDANGLRRRVDSIQGVGTNPVDIVKKLWTQLELVIIEDTEGAGWLAPVVNELCPRVKPSTVREYLLKVFNGA